MKKIFTMIAAAAVAVGISAQDQAPAFPGAEGFGRYVKGGRQADFEIRHVTNLNDSGEGSFRNAVKSGTPNKGVIVVFDVSGYIDLKSDVKIGSYVTILGQTAPGDGITLRYYTVQPGDRNIIRFLRVRRSQVKDVNDGADASWKRQGVDIMIDHCSFSWSIDEIASFYDNKNFTMQWCTISEGLCNPGHSKGAHSYGGIWGGKNASFHHNFIAHVQNRAPRFNGARYGYTGYDKSLYTSTVDGERVDFRNCVMYNWGTGGCYGGPGGGYINMVNNYYKAGPGTSNKTRVTQVTVATSGNADSKHPELYGLSSRYFIDGNYVEAASEPENYDWKGVVYDGGLSTINGERYIPDAGHQYGEKVEYVKNNKDIDCVALKLTEPSTSGEVTTHDAQEAYAAVLDHVGASLYRDGVDARNVEECRTGTVTYLGDAPLPGATAKSNTKGILDYINDPEGEENPKTASFPVLKEETRPADFDTDNDGIPDEWELNYGLDPNDPNDAKAYTLDPRGWYPNIEVYANSLVEHIVKAQNAGAIDPIDEYFPVLQGAGIDNITIDRPTSEIVKIEYFSLDGRSLAEPQTGLNIRRITYTDGIVETDKVIK